MTFDEALQQFDELDGLVPTGTRSRPASPPPALTPTGDVTIRDPRNYVPRARRTLPSLDHIMTLPPEEQTAALKALGIEHRRLKMETTKLKKVTALRSGQADQGMVIPPSKDAMRGFEPMKQQKGKGYNTQLVGEQTLTPAPKGKGEQLADLYGSYIDKPNDPKARGSVRDPAYFKQVDELLPPGHVAADFGILQQNPQYRGIRMVLPQSGGSYGEQALREGAERGGPERVMTEGPVGQPDPLDPHSNRIPRYPPNYPPDMGGLREEVYGHLITRGYPVYGGTGDFGGEFPPGFNPIGFGQRELPAGADALARPRATR